jgi:excinuclease ABC subunit A
MAIAVGTPEEVAAEPASHTGAFLAELVAPAPAAGRAPGKRRKPRTKLAAAA